MKHFVRGMNIRHLLLVGTLTFVSFSLQAQIGQVRAQSRGGVGGSGASLRQYMNNTMVGDALIEIDPETRSIIVVADDATNANIRGIIDNLDQPKPQVLINVVFLEVTHRDDLDIGVDGSFSFSQGETDATVGSVFDVGAAATQGGFYKAIGDNIDVTMRALSDQGKLEVLSRPSILARNNQEAVITIGQEVPFIRNTQILQNGQQLNTVEYEDIGIILRVTPFITSDDMVEMIVAPEISTITDQTVTIQAGVTSPVFAKRSAETVVVTPNNTTIVIGGLMEDNKTESVKKIPLLGDIPILGLPFRRTVKTDTKTELLIFLTPRIVSYPVEMVAVTEDERSRTRMAQDSFSGDQIERYVDEMSEDELRDYIEALKTKLDQ